MLRVFKRRSPMNMGAWCLVAFSGAAAGSVAPDLLRQSRAASAAGAATALLDGYLGSYTEGAVGLHGGPAVGRSE